MRKLRVNIRASVSADRLEKTADGYMIRRVPVLNSAVPMNGLLYPDGAAESAAPGLTGAPAPAGHPRDEAGNYISALSGVALQKNYVGAVVANSTHAGGRTFADISVNRAQAAAVPAGARLLERLDAAAAGENVEPIHVSTGLFANVRDEAGEINGRKYSAVVDSMVYDHLAILLDEKGAATPEDGVGIFVNSSGEKLEVVSGEVETAPENKMSQPGFLAWLKSVFVGNNLRGLTFDEVHRKLSAKIPQDAWIRSVKDGEFTYHNHNDSTMWRQQYHVDEAGEVVFDGAPEQGEIRETFVPKGGDVLKEKIVLALNSAGVSGVAAMSDDELLTAYSALQAKPVRAEVDQLKGQLTAVNAEMAALKEAAGAAEKAERAALLGKITANSALKAEDLTGASTARLRELAGSSGAAPVLLNNSQGAGQYDYAANLPD